jgi:ElaB/YqjD/DUF883 family membrane-anchored ribosome-binding protein
MFNNTKEGIVKDIRKEVDTCASIANKAGKKLREELDSAEVEINNTTANLAKKIQDKPLQSGLIAVGLGFVLGALFRR